MLKLQDLELFEDLLKMDQKDIEASKKLSPTSQKELVVNEKGEYLYNDFYYSSYYRTWIKASKKGAVKDKLKVVS